MSSQAPLKLFSEWILRLVTAFVLHALYIASGMSAVLNLVSNGISSTSKLLENAFLYRLVVAIP